jgi:hypothetical protein
VAGKEARVSTGGATVRWSRSIRFGAAVAVLVIYSVIIPLLGVSTTNAHKTNVHGKWAYSVDKSEERLDIFDQSSHGNRLSLAVRVWDELGPIRYRLVNRKKRKEAEVLAHNFGTINSSHTGPCYEDAKWLGLWDAKHPDPDDKPDLIYFNQCLMTWDGGYYPVFGRNVGPVSSTRQARTVVHEVGHAHGLDHANTYSQCASVMRDIEPDESGVCYEPGSHDEDDMAKYWPR